MKQKTFFTLAAALFMLIAGYFSIQLLSMHENSCHVYFDFECDAKAQLLCLGDAYLQHALGGICQDEKCVEQYEIYCNPDGPYTYITDIITCEDDFSPTCAYD